MKSGLSGAEFAAQLGVKEATLRHWKWVLGREQRAARRGAAVATFVEVAPPSVSVDAAQRDSFEVVLRDDRLLRVPGTFDEAALRRLLAILEER